MKHIVKGTFTLFAGLALVGCSGLHPQPADYDHLPGSGPHMLEGPGMLHSGDKKEKSAHNNGYLIYSDNPSKKPLLGSKKSGEKASDHKQSAATDTGNASSQTQMSQGYQPSESKKAQFQQFQEFQAYKHYKQFEDQPSDSTSHKKFQEWKEWQQYKKWKNSGGS